MMKVKKGTNTHKSRTIADAIKEVQKVEEVQISFHLPKDKRKKFKRMAEDNDSTMKDALLEYINTYIA